MTEQLSDAKLFRDLGHPVRLQILKHLMGGEKNVGELIELLGGLSQGRVSTHLTWLRWCGYVYPRRDGKNVYYGIKDQRVVEVLHALPLDPSMPFDAEEP